MEADWEIEVGGDAPVIDALWCGYVDLRHAPERIGEVEEAAAFPALARLLLDLNRTNSPLWTAKCDLWEPESGELTNGESLTTLACYIDLLLQDGLLFAQWQQAEALCRQWVARLHSVLLPECRVDMVVRLALANEAQGFGITVYLSASRVNRAAATEALATALDAFAAHIPLTVPAFAG